MRDRVRELLRSVGENIRIYRRKRGWSQAELAHLAGIEPRSFQRVEAGETGSIATLTKLADVLGVSMAALFRERKHRARRSAGRPRGS